MHASEYRIIEENSSIIKKNDICTDRETGTTIKKFHDFFNIDKFSVLRNFQIF